jgi:hypothetical protein
MTLSYKINNTMKAADTSNSEWPEFTINHSISVSEQTQGKFIVPTATASNDTCSKQHIDVKSLSAQDLNSLKKKDAFMYYSIPAGRSAALLNKEVDMSKLDEVSTVMKRNCTSCPSRIMTQEFATSCTVERASRISFECHADLLIMDLMEEEKEFDEEECDLWADEDLTLLFQRFST